MDASDLIRRCVDEGAARPLLHPLAQSLLWLTAILVYLFLFLFINGFRPGITEKLALPNYMLELITLGLIGSSAIFAAFCLSRPDGMQLPWVKYAPFPFLVLWVFVAFFNVSGNISTANLWASVTMGQFDCPLHILLFSGLPGVGIFYLIHKGAVIRYYRAGILATLSVTVFAYLFMRLLENNDNPAHLIIWHALPIFLMCLLGMVAGRRTLRWHLETESLMNADPV